MREIVQLQVSERFKALVLAMRDVEGATADEVVAQVFALLRERIARTGVRRYRAPVQRATVFIEITPATYATLAQAAQVNGTTVGDMLDHALAVLGGAGRPS